ncbi:MAG TPA: DNA polymerase III subunit delta' [Anaerolineae bacterium]|nr:DNA polymerase III subunit delta' [Anaerolineae bacterium]
MNWQIIGHNWAVTLLRQAMAMDRVAHAYLFSGPPQIGKTRLARTLAQALNCVQPDPPCGKCSSCGKIEQDAHPDVRLIQGQGGRGSIKIDQVRALQREAVLSPYEGRYRVYILRQVDLATIEAANSLLKTLEEPPAHVVLVLTTADADLLPTTVVSRCQHLDLRPASHDTVKTSLCDRGTQKSRAKLLARLSGGRVGWALHAAQDDNVLQRRQADLAQLFRLLAMDRVERLDFAQQASRDSVSLSGMIELWTIWWRDLLLLHANGDSHIINVDRIDELRWLLSESTLPQVWGILTALQATAAQLEANVNARLALEALLFKLPRLEAKAGAVG